MTKIKTILTGLLISTSLFLSAQTTIVGNIMSGGINRSYRLYIPAAYTGTVPRPLVLDFHGYTSNAANEQLYSNFMPIADTANFLILYPEGTSLNGQPYWNAGISNTGVNDVQFISDLIGTIKNNYAVDPNSVYSCGMSNGGYMSHTLASTLGNKIAAIASVTGSMFYSQLYSSTTSRAVPVMQISGTGDATVPYAGNTNSLPIDTLVKYWASINNCNPTPVFTAVPDVNTGDGCTAEHYVFSGGTSGATVELYKIIGGGHAWPGSPYIIGVTNLDFNASLQIWLFFRKYKLNQFVGINELVSADNSRIYPNPCTNVVYIDGENIGTIMIMDLNGKVVMETNKKQIDVSSLAKGVYSVVIVSENYRSVKKLVKL
ncbi:MAG: T9SS type A sorting domain-containing protein [Bacteroidota bacterium]